MSPWREPIALLAIMLTTFGGIETAAASFPKTTTANIKPTSESSFLTPQGNWQLAQVLVGQCRAAKQRIFVYTQRSIYSQTIRTIAPDEQVTLADSGSDGWIAIRSPAVGYVQTSELKACQQQTTPPQARNPPNPNPKSSSRFCRLVTYKDDELEGLVIRLEPNRSSRRVSGVLPGETVTLKNIPLPLVRDSEGRSWVEITAPAAGWISLGYPGSNSINLTPCP
ncbi:MAG: SH3 domain-containing protein [Symploca sp. SIO2E6]|nr:SH3 domain-containing protein [Symploca sp. SIO2E6]